MKKLYNLCTSCPRQCKIERTTLKGFCNENEKIRIAKIIKNFQWEEPFITGEKGTLAIFFSGCNLRCDYCQNYEISRGGVGKEYSIDEFIQLVEENQDSHSSIDLITPTHFSKQIALAFEKINKQVPIVWNTNSYETIENIKLVSNFVDVFLADFKYATDELGKKFSACKNYFSCALPAIQEMAKQKPDIIKNEFMQQGLIIRHLVLPNHIKNSIAVLDLIKTYFPKRVISLMSQFTPNGKSQLDRKLNPIEYKAVVSHLKKLGLQTGYVQDCESASDCFVPKFV